MVDNIKEIIVSVLQEEGCELVDLIYRKESGKQILRLLVDREGGIKLGDCVMLNEKISRILDEGNLIQESYLVEVDSPGLDRYFTGKRDYERTIGRLLRVTLNQAILKKKEYIGRLKEVLDDSIKVDVEKKGIIDIPFTKIVRARQEVEF